MQLVIPMSGRGDRFLQAGYRMPKPLIPIDGKPMVEHVLDLFPGVDDVIFICNTDHLAQTPLRAELQRLRPGARIVGIAPHKLGPVHATLQAGPWIAPDDEVIVNYCDFSARWDFAAFRRTVRETGCDGCITAYRGFHPHSLGDTLYAYLRERGGWMEEIREKAAFTDQRMQEYASAGTYYFAKGRHVTRYCTELMRRPAQAIHGEFYVSLVYNLMRAEGLKTWIYELDQFVQWGTPEDLEDYLGWSRYFLGRGANGLPSAPAPAAPHAAGTNLVPMAGAGQRFAQAGYDPPKPLIPVDGAPMVVQATRAYPAAARWVFVAQQAHLDHFDLAPTLRREYPSSTVVPVAQLTAGQAATCLLAEPHVPPERPLFIGACDHSMVWDTERFAALATRYDALIWTFQGFSTGVRRRPSMYSYVETAPDGTTARRVSTKAPLSDRPERDPVVVGAFWFRQARDFFAAARALMQGDERHGGERYVDTAMNAAMARGLRVGVFPIDQYLGWGTPDELKTYDYWQRYFAWAAQCSPS